MADWLGVASDFVGAVALAGQTRARRVCWQYGLEWRCWGEMSGYHSF